MKFPVVVIGYTNLDEDIYPSGKVEVRVGGGGYFAARSASRELGKEKVLFVTKVGSDFDTKHFNSLNFTGISISQEKTTSKSIQKYLNIEDLSQREITLLEGTSQLLSPNDLKEEYFSHCPWVHISTMPPAQQAQFIQALRKINPKICISIDSDIFLFTDQYLQEIKNNFLQVDVVFVNRHEYEKIEEIVPQLPFLIAKKDVDGAQILQFGKVIAKEIAPTVLVKNSTGAGDTFAGAYISQYIQLKDIKVSLKHAIYVASEFISK